MGFVTVTIVPIFGPDTITISMTMKSSTSLTHLDFPSFLPAAEPKSAYLSSPPAPHSFHIHIQCPYPISWIESCRYICVHGSTLVAMSPWLPVFLLSNPGSSPLLSSSLLNTVRISRLPESFGTPLTWSAAELSELQYPHLEREVQEQREEWKGFHSSLKASSAGCGVTEEELSWAMGVAYSRAFRRGSGNQSTDAELMNTPADCLPGRLAWWSVLRRRRG